MRERDPLRRPPVLAVVAAHSGVGKTTLLEKLLAELNRRGIKVATLKHVHQAHLDLPGKDSWRHRQAGALAVGLSAGEEFLLIRGSSTDPEALLSFLPPADLVLAEGFRGSRWPRIEVIRAETGREITSDPALLAAVATDLPDLEAPVPCFPLDDPAPLADWIQASSLRNERIADRGDPLTHLDANGRARLVDVSAKEPTEREAEARAEISMLPATLARIKAGGMDKGDVLAVAQVAAIMAVKETPRLIPLCHPLEISGVSVSFAPYDAESKIEISVRVRSTGRTGVEMEALTGAGAAALTIYDMCKAIDRGMEIGRIRLVEKSGGRSGYYRREE